MDLTRREMDRWAGSRPPGVHVVMLERDDSMPCGTRDRIDGPAVVELVVYRDGTWGGTRKMKTVGPRVIALYDRDEPEAGCSCGLRGDLDFVLGHLCPLEQS